jgi:hypothetical protein
MPYIDKILGNQKEGPISIAPVDESDGMIGKILSESTPEADQAYTNLNLTKDRDPERESKIYDLSKRSGLPPPTVQENPDKVEKNVSQPKFTMEDPSKIQGYLGKSLIKGQPNTAISGDDIEALEKAQTVIDTNKGILSNKEVTNNMLKYGLRTPSTIFERGTFKRLREEPVTLKGMARAAGTGIALGVAAIPKALGELTDFVAPLIVDKRKLEFRDKYLQPITLSEDLQGWLRSQYGDTKAEELIASGFESFGTMATLFATGGTGLVLPGMSAVAGIGKTTEAMKAGAPRSKAVIAGITQAITEYLTEKIPFDILSAPATSFITKLATGAAFDVPGELVATATEMWLIDQQILGGKHTYQEYEQALIDTIFIATITTSAATTPTHIVQKVTGEVDKAVTERDQRRTLQQIMPSAQEINRQVAELDADKQFHDNLDKDHEAVQATKTAQRSDDHIKAFLKDIDKTEDVYISSPGMNQFFQTKKPEEVNALLEKIGVDTKKAQESIITGEDIVVNVGDLLTLPAEDFNVFSDDIKQAPGAYTRREIIDQKANEDIENSTKLLREDIAVQEQVNTEINRLESEIKKTKLPDAKLAEAAPVTLKGLADRLQLNGLDPVEYLKNISIKRTPLAEFIQRGKELFQLGKGIIIDPDKLTNDVLKKINDSMRAKGFDVRGIKDIKNFLDPEHKLSMVSSDYRLKHPAWVDAYKKAIGIKEKPVVKELKKEELENIDWERIKELGETESLSESGYIKPDGKLIDLSGKREGGTPGTRSLDHREVGATSGMQELISFGYVRMDFNAGTIDISKKTTAAQNKVIRELAEEHNGEIVLDLELGLGEYRETEDSYRRPEITFSREYQAGTNPDRIINDINRFFSGKEPLPVRFFQAKEGLPRGVLSIEGEKKTIELFEDADLSTVLHEIGHIALLEYSNLEKSGQANTELINDMKTIREWVGAKPGVDFTEEQSEKFARGFEAYLREGKAPTSALRVAFERFKHYLMSVYKSAIALDVTLNDDVRRVFDRMLSANIEVESAAREYGFVVKTDAEMTELGMVDADKVFAKKLIDVVEKKANEALTKDRNKNLKAKREQWIKKAKRDLKNENPVYRIIDNIITDGNALNREDFINAGQAEISDLPTLKLVKKNGENIDMVAALYGFEDAQTMIDIFVNTPKFANAVKQRVSEMQAEHDAQFSVEDYFTDIPQYREYQALIARNIIGQTVDDKAVDAAIQRNLPRWEKEAAKEVREEPLDILGRSFKELEGARVQEKIEAFRARKAKAKTITTDTMKALARDTMAAKTVKEAQRVDKFLSSMKKAASDERRAILRKDWGEASTANELGRFNYEMASLSGKIRTEVKAILDRSKQLGKSTSVKYKHQEAILHLNSKYKLSNLSPKEPGILPDYQALFATDEMRYKGFNIPEFFNGDIDNYRDLRMEQFRELANAIRYLNNDGKKGREKLMSDGVTLVEEVARPMLKEMDTQKAVMKKDKHDMLKGVDEGLDEWFSRMLNINYITKALGGYVSLVKDEKSKLEAGIIEKLRDMRDAQFKMFRDIREQVKPHRDQLVDSQRKLRKKYGKKLFVKDNGVPVPELIQNNGEQVDYWEIEQVFDMAFHRGNDGNTNALLKGYEGLNLGQVDTLLNKYLIKEDMDAVQAIIDIMETLAPLTDEVHRRIKGYPMNRVEARSWVFKGKLYRGGYYPLNIDRKLASVKNNVFAEQKDLEDYYAETDSPYAVPFAKSTHTLDRKDGHGLPVELSLINIDKHFDQASRYITMAEGIRDVDRIITYQEKDSTGKVVAGFEKSATRIMGENVYNQLRPALKHFANPVLEGVDTPGNGFTRYLRNIAIPAHLAWRTITGIKQFGSLPAGIHELGKDGRSGNLKYVKGVSAVIKHGTGAYSTMNKKSDFMMQRQNAWERDFLKSRFDKMTPAEKELSFGDVDFTFLGKRITIKGRNLTWKQAVDMGYVTVRIPDLITVTPLWWAGYIDKIEQGATEKDAVRYADNIIEDTQPIAQPLSLSAWFREGGFWSVFNLHQTYTVGIHGQRQRTWFRGFKNGEISLGKYAMYNFMEAVLPLTLSAILISFLRGGDITDPEEQKDIAVEIFSNWMLMGIPMFKSTFDVLYHGQNYAPIELAGGREFEKSVHGLRAAGLMITGFDDMSQREQERALWSLATALSIQLRIPVADVARQLFEGETIKEKAFKQKRK